MEWEYATESWTFMGPGSDEWPHSDEWQAEQRAPTSSGLGVDLQPDRPKTSRAEELRAAYYSWRDSQESEWLNQMGEAGFELVAVYRHEDWGRDAGLGRWFPIVTVFCYFKRPRMLHEELPEKPRIGFQPLR